VTGFAQPRILVVDDEPANRRLVQAILAPEGATMIQAADGAEALAIVAAGGVDLVLLDVMMPGLDGIEVCRRIRAGADYVPIVLVTALADDASRVRGKEAGADDFLTKPIHEDELIARSRNLLQLRAYHAEVVAQRQAAERDARRWRLMSDVAAAVASCRDYDCLLAQLKNALAAQVPIACAGVLDLEVDHLRLQAACGLDAVTRIPPIAIDAGGQRWLDRLRTQPAVRLRGADAGPLAPILTMLEFGDAVAVPVMGAGSLRGVFVAACRQPFTAGELDVLAQVAPHIGNAVNNVRLHLRSERLLRSRDELSQLIVHDLRNLLTAAEANLELANDDSIPADERQEMITDAQGATRRLTALVSDLLDVGAAEEGLLAIARRPTDVVALARQAVNEIVPSHAARAGVIAEPGCPAIAADPGLLQRVFENVLANAVRYAPPTGRIDVTIAHHGPMVTIAISNDGPPIDPDLRPRLFQKYEGAPTGQRPGRARGLGLYFCRMVVEAHGGTIHAANPAHGACFEIALPQSA